MCMAQSNVFSNIIIQRLLKDNKLKPIDIITEEPEDLSRKTSVSYKDILAVRGILLAELSAFPRNGESLLNDAKDDIGILSTGCSCLDDLLCGGVYTSELTEICGPGASGKTQLCMSLALQVAGETEQNVIYIDSGGSVDTQRLQGILQHSNMTEQMSERLCRKIQRHCVFDAFELITVLEEIKHHLCNQKQDFYSSVKLIVIDCITSLLSPFLGIGQSEGYGVLAQITRLLRPLAVDCAVAIVITNNVVEWDSEIKPSMGKSWASVPSTRIQLFKVNSVQEINRECGVVLSDINKRDSRVKAVLVKSTKQKTGNSTDFKITDFGIQPIAS